MAATIAARYASLCPTCGQRISKGASISKGAETGKYVHAACAPVAEQGNDIITCTRTTSSRTAEPDRLDMAYEDSCFDRTNY